MAIYTGKPTTYKLGTEQVQSNTHWLGLAEMSRRSRSRPKRRDDMSEGMRTKRREVTAKCKPKRFGGVTIRSRRSSFTAGGAKAAWGSSVGAGWERRNDPAAFHRRPPRPGRRRPPSSFYRPRLAPSAASTAPPTDLEIRT